ncbi:TPA: patatin-like phospholipase family protein [Enterococcus faecium]
MEIKKVYFSQKMSLYSPIQQAKQPLPFFQSHQESRDAFWRSAKKQCAFKAVSKKYTVYFTIAKSRGDVIFNNLLIEGETFEWKKFFRYMEACARFFIKENCCFLFQSPLSEEWLRIFHKNGYQGTTQLNKKLVYHTALVLGGGGAHGAYQIGVWQALKEHDINFEIITGTSVGALNGALILQGDMKKAVNLWKKLSTRQVLALPEMAAVEDLRERFYRERRQMTKTALIEGGVSSAPLEKMVKDNLDLSLLKHNPKIRLYTVSTKLPELAEVVTDIQQTKTEEIPDWILASASFYPAMAYRKIGKNKYADGGYRNKIPIDIAINKGATEAFVVDVQGPGPAKKIRMPDIFIHWKCQTLWTLGSFLLFDSQRNQLNLQLGYLEMKKRLGYYYGNWYTFHSVKPARTYWRGFLSYLTKEIQLELSFFKSIKFWQKLRNLYKNRVVPETCGLAMLELLAKKHFLMPNEIYQVDMMIQMICQQDIKSMPDDLLAQIGQLSTEEWRRYRKYQQKIQNERTKTVYFDYLLQGKRKDRLQHELLKQPVDTLLILYLYYLKEEQPWHKNFHMKS